MMLKSIEKLDTICPVFEWLLPFYIVHKLFPENDHLIPDGHCKQRTFKYPEKSVNRILVLSLNRNLITRDLSLTGHHYYNRSSENWSC